MRNQLAIVFLVCPVEAGLNNPQAQGIKVGHLKLLQLPRKEFAPLPRAFFIDVRPALYLFINPQTRFGS